MVFGKDRYTACPVIRYVNGYYYMLYLERVPGQWKFVTYITRSKDLENWEYSPFNPVLEPGEAEGINNSDVDLVEYKGKVLVYYVTGDQRTWGDLKRAEYNGTLQQLLESQFPPGR